MTSISSQCLAALQAITQTVVGVSIGDPNDRSTWRVDFADGATDAQKASAQAAMEVFTPSNVPAQVTKLQGRLALNQAGLLQQVEVAITASDIATQIWYRDAPIWERSDLIIARLAAQLSLSPAQVDALFCTAATL